MTSPVLTSADAARWLRLDTDHDDIGSAVKALHRYVQQGRLRPLRIGRHYKFTLDELERFVANEVEQGTPSPLTIGHGDTVNGDSGPSAQQSARGARQETTT